MSKKDSLYISSTATEDRVYFISSKKVQIKLVLLSLGRAITPFLVGLMMIVSPRSCGNFISEKSLCLGFTWVVEIGIGVVLFFSLGSIRQTVLKKISSELILSKRIPVFFRIHILSIASIIPFYFAEVWLFSENYVIFIVAITLLLMQIVRLDRLKNEAVILLKN